VSIPELNELHEASKSRQQLSIRQQLEKKNIVM